MTEKKPRPIGRWRKLYDGTWGGFFNEDLQPGTVVTMRSMVQTPKTMVTKALVTSGIGWQLWTLKSFEAAAQAETPKQAALPVPPTLRRVGVVVQQMQAPNEPPPPTDADAPSWIRGTPTWPNGEMPRRNRPFPPRARTLEEHERAVERLSDDEVEALHFAFHSDIGEK